ncbi:hypothetical protein GCM10010468_43930 [Actinocorallia longicatena]|uniref:HTH tetR-type domain-containing protein n=2 Tax=Actinocorallia longicatena TaxID=111803 RepID=A0ABP6QCG8_9ACTN
MEAVAQAAGVTKSTLYGRFPDKRTLFLAVSAWALTRQVRDVRALGPLPDEPADALLIVARGILARSVDPDIVRINRMAIAESERFPEFAASTRTLAWSPHLQTIVDLLRRYEQEATMAVPDVELTAEHFFAMVGALPAWLAAYGIRRTPEEEERHLRHAVALFLDGVLARTARPAQPDSRSAV